MPKVVRFPVYFEAVGYHDLKLPDDIDPDDDDAVRQFIDDHWDDVPIPEDHGVVDWKLQFKRRIPRGYNFDWDSYIEIFDE